eukprot:XP_011442351.1 PREDICTED: uncharacterized protein LOC105338788 [Crassostrea gigas]
MYAVAFTWLLGVSAALGQTAENPCTYLRGITGLSFYESRHSNGQWIVMNCAQGSAYNDQTCSCSDFISGCKLYATSNVNQFAYIVNGIVYYKTCSFDTVYKSEFCGCY